MKKSQIDKAIDQLESEVAVLNAAIQRLKQQQTKAPVRRPRAVPGSAREEKASA